MLEENTLMEHVTTAGAGTLIINPLWLQAVSPALQTVGVLMGIAWIGVQMYYTIKNKGKR
jgi:hypothetical protein